MILRCRILSTLNSFFHSPFETRFVRPAVVKNYFRQSSHCSSDQSEKSLGLERNHADIVISKVITAKTESEVFQFLVRDFGCNKIPITHSLVAKLLRRFQDDWKSALGVFRWVETHSGYKPAPELYDKLVDILGKMKQMEKMKSLVEEMREHGLVSLNTISKMMRRSAGARGWRDAVETFDNLENFGLEKNTESMNVLLDTLCKEKKVDQARSIFLELRSHIPPNANTYNIFIHGWCKINRVEEAQWTIQEMKGHGFRPCVISYSTIIQFYCFRSKFYSVYEVLDEMQAQGCSPNVVTFTTIMHSLTKSGDLEQALHIRERMKLAGCKPDTQFYNALMHTLGLAGRVEEAFYILTKEMPENKVNPSTSSYNTMIAMFCHHRQELRALQCLRNLENSRYCEPDVQSYYPLLKLCFRDGKTDESLASLLDGMIKKHHLSLDLSSFTLLIHGLCRGNKCEWAYELFKEMIGQNIVPRYLTCSVLLHEIKQKNMYEAAEVIEAYMKKMKSL